jgi:hypothetical protein
MNNKKWIYVIIILFIILVGLVYIYFSNIGSHWESKNIIEPKLNETTNEWSIKNIEEKKVENLWANIDCSTNKNNEIKKEFKINISDIKNPEIYKEKRKEVVNLINQCYEVTLKEEYEVLPWETSWQEWVFKNKVSLNSRVFDKIKLQSELNLYDYEWVSLDGWLTYIYIWDYESIFNYYANLKIENFRQTPTQSETELIWTDIETTDTILTIEFTKNKNNETLIKFNLNQKY